MAYNLTASGLTLGSDIFNDVRDIGLAAYPVGAIYMSLISTSPATLFGGTWEALDDGRVLIGANSTYEAGSTGGEATHTLTVNEMQSHSHTVSGGRNTSGSGRPDLRASNASYSCATSSVGGSQPHNNMQPYLAVYMWRRTG